MLRTPILTAALLVLGYAHALPAQVIYTPVQYQYGDQNRFYYGGSDPAVFARAAALNDPGTSWGRVNGFDFASADVRVHREVDDQPPRVYSDAVPGWDAAVFGFTATDAANAANASVPRYLRKAGVIAAARAAHGLLIVPATATPLVASDKVGDSVP
jgi:hypothetical protein